MEAAAKIYSKWFVAVSLFYDKIISMKPVFMQLKVAALEKKKTYLASAL